MSSIRETAEKPTRYKRFADMTWPTVDSNLQWKLRYAPESVSREDQMYLASVVGAYAALVDANQKKRNLVCRELRKRTD